MCPECDLFITPVIFPTFVCLSFLSLNESLMVHLENGPYPDVDLKTFKREDVEKIPASILTVHAVEVWKKIHRTVRSRK